MADLAAGLLLATGVLAALVGARETGAGTCVEVPLLAAAFAVQVQDLVWLPGEAVDVTERPASRGDLQARAAEIGLGLATNPYYRCYEAADSFLAVACLNLAQRQAFIGHFGLEDSTIEAPDLIPEDPSLVEQKRIVTSEIAARIAAEPADAWLVRFGQLGVPCGPVLARETVHADPQVRANGFLADVEQPGIGAVTMLGRLFQVGDNGRGPLGAAPLLGADTEAVFAELGVA